MCTRGAQALKALGSPSFKTEEKAQENRHINGPGASSLSEAGSWRTPHCAQQAPERPAAAVSTPGAGKTSPVRRELTAGGGHQLPGNQ